jgi:hypothetical protein
MVSFYFGRSRCVRPRRYNVPGSHCNKLKKRTCKRTSGCSYTRRRGCGRRVGPKVYSPDNSDFSSYVSNAPYSMPAPAAEPEYSLSGDEDLGSYADEAGITFFGRRRRRSSFGARRSTRRRSTRRKTTRRRSTRRKTTRRKVSRRKTTRRRSTRRKVSRRKHTRRYKKSSRSGCSMLKKSSCEASSMCEYVKRRGCKRKMVHKSHPGYSMKSMDDDDNLAAYDAEAGFTWMGRKKCPKGKRGAKCRAARRRYRKKAHRKAKRSHRKGKRSHRRKSSFGKTCRKLPKSLVKKARKAGIKTTKKVGSHRVQKSMSLLKRQIARRMRSMRR